MRSGLFLLVAISQICASPVHAGAWLREEGTGFLSTAFSATYFRDIAAETYAEYGVRPDLTLGIDVGLYTLRNGRETGYATAFMRRPLGNPDGPSRLSYELGIGAGWVGDEVTPHIKTGLSWGRGLQLKERSGWVNIDASVTWDLGHSLHVTKLDTTVGLNFTDRTSGMLQLHVAHIDAEVYSTLAPSVILTPKWANFRIQVGALAPLENLDNTALKLGIWREF